MKEYITPIYDEEQDWDETFVGAIRKYEELIRCKDCRYFADCICEWHTGKNKWIVDDDD